MNLQPETDDQPWWNRPLLGKISFLERLIGAINRQQVPELALSLHNTELDELNRIAPVIQMQDNDSFSQEFLLYIFIKNQIENNKDEYKGLLTFIKILQFAIEKNSHFKNIQKIESDYQGKTQLELYEFVFEQLNNNLDKSIFRQNVHEKVENLISIIRNELIQNILRSYVMSLDNIAENEIGLNLLLLFKKYKIADYTIFNIIADILKQLVKQDLQNLKALVLVVKVNYEQLEKLGQLIGIPTRSNEPMIYAKILQYIALLHKYETLNYRFNQLVTNLNKWEKHYKTINDIRIEYPSHKYHLPQEFLATIPGENIYQKYKDYLHLVQELI